MIWGGKWFGNWFGRTAEVEEKAPEWAQNPGIYDIRKDPWMIQAVRDDEDLPILLAAFLEVL